MKKIKDTERILKATLEKQLEYVQGNMHKTSSWLLRINFASQKGVTWYIQSDGKEKAHDWEYCTCKAINQIKGDIKEFYRRTEAKIFQHHSNWKIEDHN